MTRIKLNHRPPDWRSGLRIDAPDVVIRTVSRRGAVIELDTTFAEGTYDLVAVAKPFGGCRIELDGRFQMTEEHAPQDPMPNIVPMLNELAVTVSDKIRAIRERDDRLRSAQAAIENGADPLDHEGSDWSDIWE